MSDGPGPCILTIDVEEWFHILDSPLAPPMEEWERLPSRVERNVDRLLDILRGHNTSATFFFLGWIADRFPDLVLRVRDAGHEIASHGYAHELVSSLRVEEFAKDITRTRKALESITGGDILGYRAPGFSLPLEPGFVKAIQDAGYTYDSSLFPGHHSHAEKRNCPLAPHQIPTGNGDALKEYPVSLVQIAGKRVCLFGGGYLRLAPYPLIRWATRRVRRSGRPVIFYLHPREIDPDQPRLPLSGIRRFRTYINLESTERKLKRLLSDFDFITLADLHQKASV